MPMRKLRKISITVPMIIDIGGESSRPGSEPISIQAEIQRVVRLLKK